MRLSNAQLCLALAMTLASAIPAFGQTAKDEQALYIAQAFVGHCAQNPGRNDKVEAAARQFGYEELEGEEKLMLGPQDPNVKYSGWIVKEEGQPAYLLGVSEGLTNDVPYSNCTVANPNVSMDEVLSSIRSMVTIGNVLQETEGAGQRYRAWQTDTIAARSFLSATDAPKLGISGGTVSLSAPKEK